MDDEDLPTPQPRWPASLSEAYDLGNELRCREAELGHRVVHRHLRQSRLLKRLKPEHAGNRQARERLLREARVAGRLHHPAIPKVHDCGTDEDATYVVLDLVDGQPLAHFLRHGIRLHSEDVVEVGRQLVDALGHMHEEGYVHRGVTPANVVVDLTGEDPVVKLIGLGASCRTGQRDPVEEAGEELYSSPEQYESRGRNLDGRSDLYCAGVLLYELLTLENPLVAKRTDGTRRRDPDHRIRDFAETDAEGRIPPALRAVLTKALARDRTERYAGADELLAALSSPRRAPLIGRLALGGLSLVLTLLLVWVLYLGFRGAPGEGVAELPIPKDAGEDKPFSTGD